MKKNMGSTDRIIRIIVAIILIGLFATSTLTGTWGIVSLVVAGMFIVTSLVSTCPLYLPFGIRTNRVRKHAN
ncbi:YgaP family membrane protein [Spirosoma gilvum]